MIRFTSSYKKESVSISFLTSWKLSLEKLNKVEYGKMELHTTLGKTIVWTINSEKKELPPLVCFPGARTSILYWDLDRALDPLRNDFRIYLVETNGQPGLSDMNSPEINSDDYGHWASQVLDLLNLPSAYIAGASFGGIVGLRLARVAPQKIKKLFLLCPGGIQNFSMSFRNFYYNILPILSPSIKNITTFLNKAILCSPNHRLSDESMDLLVSHAQFALTHIKNKTQNPAKISNAELSQVNIPVYLFCGEKDLLFPGKRTEEIAKKYIPGLKHSEVLTDVAHGIEVYKPVFEKVKFYIQNAN